MSPGRAPPPEQQAAAFNFRYWLAGRARASSRAVLGARGDPNRYLTYEPWRGGFNNVRMSLELAAALAFALNRTLVWSPAAGSRLLATATGLRCDCESLLRACPIPVKCL